ncbi:helix-turn-helix transcriptional regulator (plasmid) [Providencia rettgeri]|uniref:helix-turn-helix domain-containing protein n=1 Tax=Providencia rettgeri TaxID=587 RepID=UPI001CA70ECD|nr:helix-turn-helix transcriptional regulator [Providencia rettgeri]QZY66509.1 helix-turn-helix transcriptional regulator [Providencia rettgeri]
MNFSDEISNEILNAAVCSFLKKVRVESSLSGKELATLLKISQQQISRYENGQTQLTLSRINQYINVFGLSWREFSKEVIKYVDEVTVSIDIKRSSQK